MHSESQLRIGSIALAVASPVAALPARAGSFFDFEDNTLQGWLPTQTGGVASSGVESHLGRLMTFAQHTGSHVTSVSHDFTCGAGDDLAFDMQAIMVPGGFSVPGYAGVNISFLNAFNVSQGGFSLVNTTGAQGTNQYLVDPPPLPADLGQVPNAGRSVIHGVGGDHHHELLHHRWNCWRRLVHCKRGVRQRSSGRRTRAADPGSDACRSGHDTAGRAAPAPGPVQLEQRTGLRPIQAPSRRP